ncbi:MAG: DUF5615 family PIN-like protein [Cyanobacteria bacterium P01_H01_bin.21]
MSYVVDHNLEGHAVLISNTIAAEGWLELLTIRLVTFEDVGLPFDSSDRVVWQFAQSNQMILLTANRNMKGDNSLEEIIRKENTNTSLPVVTISNLRRLGNSHYREQCAERLVAIILDLDKYLGTGRLYIP